LLTALRVPQAFVPLLAEHVRRHRRSAHKGAEAVSAHHHAVHQWADVELPALPSTSYQTKLSV